VFEVVVPKPQDDPLEYEKPLPLDLLPYQERTDKYRSFGTAFYIGDNQFVTAAHVLNLDNPSQWTELSLRDTQGNIYPITQILSYDNLRDFALFQVEGFTGETFLPISTNSELNQAVYAVGNTHGEGIIIRDGLLTSKTPERYEGRWNWLRYSAAAGPGNSGGPLLNQQGEIIGIVTAKSENENLNYALPVEEMLKAPQEARLEYKIIYALPNITTRYKGDFEETFSTPVPLEKLQNLMQEYHNKRMDTALTTLLEDNRNSIFPYDLEGQKELMVTRYASTFPVIVREKDDSTWVLSQPENVETTQTDEKRYLHYGEMYGDTFFEMGGLSPSEVEALLEDSTHLGNTFLKSYPLNRNVGGEQIRVTSLGRAIEEISTQDTWGRKWFSYHWNIPFANRTAMLCVSPQPTGLVGLWTLVNTGSVFEYQQDFEEMFDFIQFSYYGEYREWKEFLAQKTLIPEEFKEFKIQYEPFGSALIRTKDFSFSYAHDLLEVQDQGTMYLAFSFPQGDNQAYWSPYGIYLTPQKGSPEQLNFTKNFPPAFKTDTDSWESWLTIKDRKYPYTGENILSKGKSYILDRLDSHPTGDNPESLKYAWTFSLTKDGEQDRDRMKEFLLGLTDSVNLSPAQWEGMTGTAPKSASQEVHYIQDMTLFQAITNNKTSVVKDFIDRDLDLNLTNSLGQTPFMAACRRGKDDMITLFLNKGNSNINHQDNQGMTPLHHLLINGSEDTALKLIAQKPDINLVSHKNYSPLMEALRKKKTKAARAILDMNPKLEVLDQQNELGRSALYYASYAGANEIVEDLVQKGVDLSVGEESGYTVLQMALKYCSPQTVRMLLNKEAPIDGVNPKGFSTLMYALMYGESDSAWNIAKSSTDYDRLDDDGWTPLLVALRYGHPDIARYLIDRGVRVNKEEKMAFEPLYMAIKYSDLETVKKLVEEGAQLEWQTQDTGHSPLALSLNQKKFDITRYILEQNPPLDPITKEGWSIMALALRYAPSDLERLIWDYTRRDFTQAQLTENWNELHLAARYSNREMVEKLVEAEVFDVNAQTEDGVTPLMLAARYNPLSVVPLVRGGATVSEISGNGDNALHYALRGENLDIIKLLIEMDCDMEHKNSEGKSPRDLAQTKSEAIRNLFP